MNAMRLQALHTVLIDCVAGVLEYPAELPTYRDQPGGGLRGLPLTKYIPHFQGSFVNIGDRLPSRCHVVFA